MTLQVADGTSLVSTHQGTVAGYIGGEDGGQPAERLRFSLASDHLLGIPFDNQHLEYDAVRDPTRTLGLSCDLQPKRLRVAMQRYDARSAES